MSVGSADVTSVPPWLTAGVALRSALAPFLVTLVSLGVVDGISLARARKVVGSHWTERAREAWTARHAIRAVLGSALAAAVIGFGIQQSTPCLPAMVASVTRVCGFALAVMFFAAIRRLRPTSLAAPSFATPRSIALWTVLAPQQLGLLGFVLPLRRLDAAAGALTGVLLVAAVAALGLGWPLARKLGLVREASPRLAQAVRAAADRTGVGPPLVVELDPRGANAWAFPLAGVIAFTRGALDSLDDNQLAAVAAHELTHLAEPRWISWTRWAVSLAWIPYALMMPLLTTYGAGGLLLACGPLLAGKLAFQRLARRMELGSDSSAIEHQGEPGVYATALERLYERGLLPAVAASSRSTHPNLYDRLIAAGVQPAYPRPARPSGVPALLGVVALVMINLGVSGAEALLSERILDDEERRFSPELFAIVGGCDPSALASAAAVRLYDGDPDDADRWYKIAHALDASGETFLQHAQALALLGDCDGADSWLASGRERVERAASTQGPAGPGAVTGLAVARSASRLCRERIRGVAPGATAGEGE